MEQRQRSVDVSELEGEVARLQILLDTSQDAQKLQLAESQKLEMQLELTDVLAQLDSRRTQVVAATTLQWADVCRCRSTSFAQPMHCRCGS